MFGKKAFSVSVLAIALLSAAGPAAAATEAYEADSLNPDVVDIEGTNPRLEQDQGIASITDEEDMGSFLRVTVTCHTPLVVCIGDVVTDDE